MYDFSYKVEGITLQLLHCIINCIVRNEIQYAFDFVENYVISQRQQHRPLLVVPRDLMTVVLEEVIVLTVTNRQEVEQVADVDVVCDGAEVADELGVEVQHVLQVAALAADPGPADAADLHVELLHFPREVRNLRLGSDHQTVLPDPLFLQKLNETF